MPPDLFGNIDASSAWMLYCSAPMQIEIVHSTNAPPVPSAPIEPPSAAIRKPGLARATTKPSHHDIALSRDRSSTCASATPIPPTRWTNLFERAALYHPPRNWSIGRRLDTAAPLV